MRPIAARSPSRRLAAGLAALACALAAQAHGQTVAPATKPLLVLPTDNAGAPPPPIPSGDALAATEAAAFPLDLHLGMTPDEVNASLAHPPPPIAQSAYTVVPYLGPDTVVGFAVGMADAGNLKPAITTCFAPASEIVFQFDAGRLYAMSFRFARDGACPDASTAADALYQRLLAIPPAAMPSEHYRVGQVEVVDAWDPRIGSVLRQRWKPE